MKEQPLNLADFPRLAAMVGMLRSALIDTIPHVSEKWQGIENVGRCCGIDSYALELRLLTLSHFGWVELDKERVRLAPGRDLSYFDPETWEAVLNYYSDFATRNTPKSRASGRFVRDYYPVLEKLARPTSDRLISRFGRDEKILRVFRFWLWNSASGSTATFCQPRTLRRAG